ncbi:MAG: hypothetical protein M0Z27_06730 [Thermaerobacter sp.]|nr:hypothetical protein [Thermaerobacter sp.]
MVEMDESLGAAALIGKEQVEGWRSLAAQTKRLRRSAAAAVQAGERWDLQRLRSALPALQKEAAAAAGLSRSAAELVSRFHVPEGEEIVLYAREFERLARQKGLPIQGTFPEYVIFPMEVRFDLPGEQVFLKRRRLTILEPAALVQELSRRHQAILGSNFNERRFLQALVKLYDLLDKASEKKGREIPLKRIYELLTVRRGAADYSPAEFAFDIYRLRRSSDLVFEGRRLDFHHGRQTGFDVPNAQGGTDKFYGLKIWEVGEGD